MIISVSEYLDYLNTLLDIKDFTIQGEVSDITIRGNTVFFTLSDSTQEAKIDCVLWKYKYERLDFDFTEGIEIQILGKANIYKPRGKLSFVTEKISPVGEGALQNALENLKKRLENEGYFDENKKQQIPEYVNNIGLITSEHGDAKKDFLTHISNSGFKIYFYDVRVEGLQSANSVVEAIKYFNENNINIDVLVITRGGGSLESLQAFNNEEVAKAIHASKIPTISAIGHENDVTIADMVSDLRASTPTHAGKIISEPWSRVDERINSYSKNILKIFNDKCTFLDNKYIEIEYSIFKRYQNEINNYLKIIYDVQLQIKSQYTNILNSYKYLQSKFEYNINTYNQTIYSNKKTVLSSNKYLNKEFYTLVNNINTKIEQEENKLKLSDPSLKIKQGYTITRTKSGNLIKNTNEVKPGEIIYTSTNNGTILSEVK